MWVQNDFSIPRPRPIQRVPDRSWLQTCGRVLLANGFPGDAGMSYD